ncbi:hypothetical protein [Campylobacter sp.]|uniref:hypothetical protein n=1 Tax=Campylobacter sp. TaxID=205 RepID=UPI002A91723B|nr:hypothetical protein [Campylobacter sp.]
MALAFAIFLAEFSSSFKSSFRGGISSLSFIHFMSRFVLSRSKSSAMLKLRHLSLSLIFFSILVAR